MYIYIYDMYIHIHKIHIHIIHFIHQFLPCWKLTGLGTIRQGFDVWKPSFNEASRWVNLWQLWGWWSSENKEKHRGTTDSWWPVVSDFIFGETTKTKLWRFVFFWKIGMSFAFQGPLCSGFDVSCWRWSIGGIMYWCHKCLLVVS